MPVSAPPQAEATFDWIAMGLEDAYGGRSINTHYHLFQYVKMQHPDRQIISLDDPNFDVSGFLASQNVASDILAGEQVPKQHTVLTRSDYYGRFRRGPVDDDETPPSLLKSLRNGVFEIDYASTHFNIYQFHWMDYQGPMRATYLVFEAEDQTAGTKLVQSVYQWMDTLKNEVWVFDQVWRKDKAMYQAVQSAEWKDIFLEADMRQDLRRDTSVFFDSEDVYKSLNVAWKRGILLIGAPGNGKTEAIKAIIKGAYVPCLYVKSFKSPMGPEQGIRAIFTRARQSAPCILVLEDLDSLVEPTTRSFFLNELDGLESNHGILTVATTNHPEKIDQAILNRPSRFDTKYVFNLPSQSLRTEYIRAWLLKLESLGVVIVGDQYPTIEEFGHELSRRTEGWSFAYLKELFVSFQLTRAALQSTGKPAGDTVQDIFHHVETLGRQVVIGAPSSPEELDPTLFDGLARNAALVRHVMWH
ncbi:P-loop containing nucleoside triphosphate hydrolase protein [Lipomyces tetrasporus]|uniref:P-loop containing nucleoside triphosphate hydrolase protein n=1 Tax=Lipomyces tetrasporus TaxID=54092 RepID=A0AAD7VRQ0_9ASCO|nr:P-loop containing nucleoside triphosphate hydrolase protein [Lipomyces tetrasporus]KAJ8100267.1 P-loop containing nucleoside triphosphate hydrolase protein [Lipomyces tetrasporus]